jgi:hypothetical protein
MSLPGDWPQVLNFFGTPLAIEPSPGQLTSDAGLLRIRQFDPHVGVRGWCAHRGDPDRSAPTHGLNSHGRQPRGEGFE